MGWLTATLFVVGAVAAYVIAAATTADKLDNSDSDKKVS